MIVAPTALVVKYPSDNELSRCLLRDGFVVLPGFCDKTLTNSLLGVSLRFVEDVRKAVGDRDIGIGSAAGYREIVQRSPKRWDVPITPAQFGINDRDMPWWPIVSDVLGDDAEYSFSGVVCSEPGAPAQYWHIDSPHESSEHLPPHAVNVLVALHAVTREMGPTEFSPGSHVLTNHLANPRLDRDALVYQHAATTPESLINGSGEGAKPACVPDLDAGHCVVFDDRLMHRGLANRSSDNRYVGYFSYRRKGYVGTTHFESRRSVFDARD